ncbi:Methanol utilization control regulatory protein MoxX, partial [Candidatus Burkholderia humilis]
REPAVFREQMLRLFLQFTAILRLALRFLITPPREPRQADGKHEHRGGQFIELETFGATRPVIGEIADVERGKQHSGDDRHRNDAGEIAPRNRMRRTFERRVGGGGQGVGRHHGMHSRHARFARCALKCAIGNASLCDREKLPARFGILMRRFH